MKANRRNKNEQKCLFLNIYKHFTDTEITQN